MLLASQHVPALHAMCSKCLNQKLHVTWSNKGSHSALHVICWGKCTHQALHVACWGGGDAPEGCQLHADAIAVQPQHDIQVGDESQAIAQLGQSWQRLLGVTPIEQHLHSICSMAISSGCRCWCCVWIAPPSQQGKRQKEEEERKIDISRRQPVLARVW